MDKLVEDKRLSLINVVTKNLAPRFDENTMAYFVTFFTVRYGADESKLDGDSKIRRQAALQLYRSYCAMGDDYEHRYFKPRPTVTDANK